MIRPQSAILAAAALLDATPTFASGASLGIVLMDLNYTDCRLKEGTGGLRDRPIKGAACRSLVRE